jgi:hypothetical protein
MKNIITAAVIAAATFTATTASAYEAKDCPSDIEYLLLEITDVVFNSPTITPEIMELMVLQVCVDQFSTDT